MRLRLGSVEHDLSTHALVMAVLPAGGSLDALLRQAEGLVGDGADLLDLASATAGSAEGADQELARVVPVVAALRARFDVPLAVATWRAPVLAEAAAAGAVACVDSSGFLDDAFLPTASRAGTTVVVTHRGTQAGSPTYDVVGEVRTYLDDHVGRARGAGIPVDRIVVDAGLDLGKSPAQSLTLLQESPALADLGPPLLISASNGRFLGMTLGLEPEERRVASHAAAALGVARGGRIVRAHDVRGARRVADVLEALLAARLVQVSAAMAEGVADG